MQLTLSTDADLVAQNPSRHVLELHGGCDTHLRRLLLDHLTLLNLNFLVDSSLSGLMLVCVIVSVHNWWVLSSSELHSCDILLHKALQNAVVFSVQVVVSISASKGAVHVSISSI